MAIDPTQLQAVRLFAGLDRGRLEELATHLMPRSYQAETVILRHGEPTEALYFILTGRVEVVLTDSGGVRHTLATLGPGEVFGERAMLTGEPRSADVIATEGVQAVVLPRRSFEELLPRFPELTANLARQLAGQLGNWAIRHQRDERESRETLANVVGWQLLPEFERFPGSSPWVRELNERLERLAREETHVLITGERGTWKDLIARLLHFRRGDPTRPVLYLDCAAPPPVLRERAGDGGDDRDGVLLAIAQESALFGHEASGTLYARGTRRGMVELADGGDLILRNVDSLAPGVQRQLAAFLATGGFHRRGEQTGRRARIRILATSAAPLAADAAEGRFSPDLLAALGEERVELLPLRERKKDLPAIARQLLGSLNRKYHKKVRRFSHEALNLLVDHDWPLNGTELYQVLRRAVAVADGPEISAEQIFLQGQVLEDGRFNLLSLPAVERIARHPDVPAILRRLTVPLFLAVTFYALFGPHRDNLANLIVWTVWWPLLVLAAAVTARSWCTICPLEAISSWAGLSRRRKTDPPPGSGAGARW